MWECCQWPMLPVGLLVVGGWWVVCWLVGRDGRRGGRGAGFRFATWAAIRYSPRAKSPVGNWRFKSTAVTGEMSSCAAKMAALHVAARSVSGPYRGAVARGAGPTGGRSRGSATLPFCTAGNGDTRALPPCLLGTCFLLHGAALLPIGLDAANNQFVDRRLECAF